MASRALASEPDPRAPIDWSVMPARSVACPACGCDGVKPFVLACQPSKAALQRLDLHSCPACVSKFFPDFAYPEYATSHYEPGAIKFYVEVGASIDQIVAPLFATPLHRGDRYLDIGCAYGFTVDFAQHALGLEAIGIDPSQFAVAGREGLGVSIIHDHLSPTLNLGPHPFDLAVATEVIEHVLEPRAFIALIKDRLGENGALILTTPDAASINPQSAPADLLALLSPTLHHVLFSQRCLDQLLRSAGFRNVEVIRHAHTLIAAASLGGRTIDPTAAIDRGLLVSYFAQRHHSVRKDSWVAHGLAYRLLKELTNSAQHEKALQAFADLARSVARIYPIDLENPDSIAIDVAEEETFDDFAARYPMNLCGIGYFRGVLALNHDRHTVQAASYFALAERYGAALRMHLARIGCADAEMELFSTQSRYLRLRALAYTQPTQAAREALALAEQATGWEARSVAAEPGLAEGIGDLFAHLVNLGALEAAEPLAPIVSALLAHAAPSSRNFSNALRCQVRRALGLMSLNRQNAPRKAAAQLLLAERAARQWVTEMGADDALHALWRARYEVLLALMLAADARRALRAARKFTVSDAERPLIPEDIWRDAEILVQRLTTNAPA